MTEPVKKPEVSQGEGNMDCGGRWEKKLHGKSVLLGTSQIAFLNNQNWVQKSTNTHHLSNPLAWIGAVTCPLPNSFFGYLQIANCWFILGNYAFCSGFTYRHYKATTTLQWSPDQAVTSSTRSGQLNFCWFWWLLQSCLYIQRLHPCWFSQLPWPAQTKPNPLRNPLNANAVAIF